MEPKKPNYFKIMLLATLAHWISREKSDTIEFLLEYNRILKSKLELGGHRIKFTDNERAKLARKGRKISRKAFSKISELISPDTILRWYNRLIAEKYTPKTRMTTEELRRRRKYVRSLVLNISKENPTWGAGKIVGSLKHLGIRRGKTAIYKILLQNGIDPKPAGGNRKNTSWLDFIRRHQHLMVGADFLTAEVLTWRGLVRYMIFFAIDCKTRKVKIFNISKEFYGEKMERIALFMSDEFDGFLKSKKYFFCDKDPLYTKKFRSILKRRGIKVKQVPNPVFNAYAERFVQSIKSECLNHFVFFGERMLVKAVKEYEEFYNTERPHQGLDNELIMPNANSRGMQILSDFQEVPIVKSERLGGLLNFYYRKTG